MSYHPTPDNNAIIVVAFLVFLAAILIFGG